MEHPRLPNLPTLGTMTSDVANYYTEQARDDNELRLKALKDRENEVLMGVWDGCEYMNEVNWPEKTLKKNYKIEMCFSYPEAPEESRFMWCFGVVQRVIRRDNKVIMTEIKWDKEFIACGEPAMTKELPKKSLWNLETRKKGAWR